MTDKEQQILIDILQAKDLNKIKVVFNIFINNGYINDFNLKNYLSDNPVSIKTFIFIISLYYTSFPKLGKYINLSNFNSIKNTYDNLKSKNLYNFTIQTKNFYYNLTDEQAEKILPDLLLKKYYQNKNTKIKQNELLTIVLNPFAFNIFKKNIITLKYITIKDSLYYLNKLLILQSTILNNSKHEDYRDIFKTKLLFEYAAIIYTQTRNPNEAVYKALQKLSENNNLCSSYQYCLPTIILYSIDDWKFFEEKFTNMPFTFKFANNLFINIFHHYSKFQLKNLKPDLNYSYYYRNLTLEKITNSVNNNNSTIPLMLLYLLKYTSKINKIFAKMQWVKESISVLESIPKQFNVKDSTPREVYNFETYLYKQVGIISTTEKFPQFPLKVIK